MRFFFLLIYIFTFKTAISQELNLEQFINQNWKINTSQIEYLNQGNIISKAKVESIDEKLQDFTLQGYGIHPKRCNRALRKLSMFEKYSEWVSFIKKSTYKEKSRLLTLKAEHSLLPYPMLIHILVERPTKVGLYKFSFPTGIFTGLKGEFEIRQLPDKRCVLYAHSHWRGKNTKIPNFVIELFSETLSRLGGEILIRKSI